MKNYYLFLFISFFLSNLEASTGNGKIKKPVINGKYIHIYNPNDTRLEEDSTWYTNDHCFAKGKDGKWHAYGIIGHKPTNPWIGETRFFHASSAKLANQKWEDHPYALEAKKGVERVLWAPTIIEEKGINYMFYNIGNMQENAPHDCSWGQLCMAYSKDMFQWNRHELNPLFSDMGQARDSYVIKHKGKFYYYYTRTYSEVDLRSCVAVRTSDNLLEWSGPQIVHTQPLSNHYGGDAESPYVIYKDGIFYLFICRANTDYNRTDVYWSQSPFNFPIQNLLCTLPVHAAEIIYDKDEGWFISNTGWNKKGIYIAPLKWE